MGEKKTKIMLYSTLVEVEVEVGVELGKKKMELSRANLKFNKKPEVRFEAAGFRLKLKFNIRRHPHRFSENDSMLSLSENLCNCPNLFSPPTVLLCKNIINQDQQKQCKLD